MANETLAEMGRAAMVRALADAVGDDGTGDLGVVVDHAKPTDTLQDLIGVVEDAREDAIAIDPDEDTPEERRADYEYDRANDDALTGDDE